MQIYTETETASLSWLMEQARRDGEVRIRQADGQIFILRPEATKRSALDVVGIDLPISTQEIVEFVREGRERQ